MISDSVPGQTPYPEPGSGTPARPPSSRPRWLFPAAGAVIALAVVIGVVAGLTLTGQRRAGGGSAAGAAGYVPASSAVYYELRLDLPGGQHDALRSFLGHFPQFDVDKYLTDELDSQLDKLNSQPTGLRYSTDIKPWFNGTLAFALLNYPALPTAGSLCSGPSTCHTQATRVPDVLVLAGIKDQAAATAANDRLQKAIADAGSSVTTSTHAGATIWSVAPAPAGRTGEPVTFAWTITADEVVAGTTADVVGKALDVHAGSQPSFAGRSDFSSALSHLPADHVAMGAVDTRAILDQLQKDAASAAPSASAAIAQLAALAPPFAVSSARFEDDRFVLESGGAASAESPSNSERGLAAMTPSDAIMFADGGQVGARLASYLDQLKSLAGTTGATGGSSLSPMESLLGGDLSTFVSWMGDTALVAGDTDGSPYVGLISKPANAHDASLKLQQIQALLQLAAGGGGPRVQVTTSDHAGTTVTTIRFEATNGVPPWASAVQYAVTDERMVIGTGDTFVGRVLDMRQADSLAASQRFQDGIGSVGGSSNTGSFWLDLTALRTAVEPFLPADSAQGYSTLIKPWLTPFDYVVGENRTDAGQVESHAAIVLR